MILFRKNALEEDVSLAGLSARERNRLKRKSKMAKKEVVNDQVDLSSSTGFKKRKTLLEEEGNKVKQETVVIEHKAESASILTCGDEWPFEGLCELVCLDLFSPYWEVRHGAALALRELLKVHGSGAGKIVGVSESENLSRHKKWMTDLSIRLLCVLALDKFTDFVGDQAVVPVREVCAQVLGVLSRFASQDLVENIVYNGLLKLIPGQSVNSNANSSSNEFSWGVRLSALIGIKYILAIRTDLVNFLLKKEDEFSLVFDSILQG